MAPRDRCLFHQHGCARLAPPRWWRSGAGPTTAAARPQSYSHLLSLLCNPMLGGMALAHWPAPRRRVARR
eukprot:3617750-Lingulodinium_polyedra.AAC.1